MQKNIWVFIEHQQQRIAPVSLELLNEAVRVRDQLSSGGQVAAVVLGSEKEESLFPTLREYGADVILTAADERLAVYQPQYHASLLADWAENEKPFGFFFGATFLGSHLTPTVAAKLRAGVAAHSIELKVTPEDELVAVVPAFGGKVLGDILWQGGKCNLVSMKGGILPKAEPMPAEGQVVTMSTQSLDQATTRLVPKETLREEIQGVPLEEAEIVICGGWGIGDQETWAYLEQLADKLGAAVACTRPPIDEGWAPGEHLMIGTSGKSVKPQVYIGFGISGATHHVCGMKDAGIIISVNQDEQADMFQVSDYGIVGDAKKILPLLLKALEGELS